MAETGSPAQKYFQVIEQNLAKLPLLPAVVAQVLALKPERDDFLDKIHVLAKQDPTFSARLIQYAYKSVGYGSFVKEISIRHAIARLGGRNIARMAVSLSLMEAFVPKSKSDNNLWVHSVLVAVTAQHLASALPDLRLDPDYLYLGGLLHDIGRFIIFQAVPEGPSRIAETALIDPPSLLGSEIKVCGMDHVEIGVQVCRKWGMPDSIIEIVENHHKAILPCESPDQRSLSQRICLIQIADLFSILLLQCVNEAGNGDFGREHAERIVDTLMLDEVVPNHYHCLPAHYQTGLIQLLVDKSSAIVSESINLLRYLGIQKLTV